LGGQEIGRGKANALSRRVAEIPHLWDRHFEDYFAADAQSAGIREGQSVRRYAHSRGACPLDTPH